MNNRQPPLLIFALDSANYELVEKWAQEGYLPNIASVMRAGETREVGGPGVYDEIGAWTSVFSGLPQSEHGFYSSRRLKHGTYQLELANFSSTGVLPFWGTRGGSGIDSAILDSPEPQIIPGVKGIQLTSLNMHYEKYAYLPPQSEPPELVGHILKALGRDDVPDFDEFDKPQTYYVDHLHKNLARMKRRCKAFRQLLDEHDYELIVVGFGETHDIAHLMWPFDQDAQASAGCDPELAHGLRSIYQAVDAEIGLFLDEMSPGFRLMILSAYGIKSQFPTARLGELLLDRLGYRIPAKQKANLLNPISIARKIVPEAIRYRLSRYLGFDFQQKLLHESFTHGTDWSRTRAFMIPTLFQNYVRVNLNGREPQGIVDAADYPALLDEIEQQMRLITDPATGQSAISSVLRLCDPSLVDPRKNTGPDLIIHWKENRHFLEHATHPSGDLKQTQPSFNRSSYHKLPGFVIMQGPGVKPGAKDRCGILDIAPTCMDLLGVGGTDKLAGKSLVTRQET